MAKLFFRDLTCLKVLDSLRLYGHPLLPPARVEILEIEGLGFFKPLWRIVVASGGSKFSKNEGLGLLRLCVGSFWPLASRNSQKLKILDFQASIKGRHCLRRVDILTN